MAQTFPCYLMLAVFMVMVGYVAGDIQCKHNCQSDSTCNYQQIHDTCYYIFKEKPRNWFESSWFCVDQGLSMVKVTKDMIEQNQTYDFRGFFKDSVITYTDGAWLGGRAVDLSGWTFLNNTKALPENQFTPIQSDIRYNANCGFIKMDQSNPHQISVGPCAKMFAFICRFNGTRIQHVNLTMSWFDARSYCIKLGGDLLYLNKNETLDIFIHDPALTGITGNHHIGLRHRVWEWIDGSEILFTNWKINEPNTFTEKCLLLYGDTGKWNDNYCYDERLTFCQGDAESRQDSQTAGISLTAPPTAKPPDHSTPITNYSTEKTDTGMKKEDQLRVLVIILGSLLGVFFIISISFIIFFLCTKCSCKSSNEDIEIIENNYYSTPSQPENGLTTTKNNSGTNSADSTVEYSYGPPTAKATDGGSDFTSHKPVIKPKPIIGPKTGDVYSTVDKRSAITPGDTQLYVNSG